MIARRLKRFLPILVFTFSVFAIACGIDPQDEGEGIHSTPTSTHEKPNGFTLERSAYVSEESYTNCKSLADQLTTSDEVGVMRHTIVFRNRLNQAVSTWQDPRFGVSFRAGRYVITARHVAGGNPNAFPDDPRLREEHHYDFYPAGELFSRTVSSRDFGDGTVFRSGNFVATQPFYESGDDADFIVFHIKDHSLSDFSFRIQAAKGLSDFDPLCIFRLFFNDETGYAELLVLGGKSFTDERGNRELAGHTNYETYTVRVFAFYGGFSFGPGASGSPVFLKQEDSYVLIGLAFARVNGNIGIGHDIIPMQGRIFEDTGKDIFR